MENGKNGCITNAQEALTNLVRNNLDGMVVWHKQLSHAYVIPNNSHPDDYAINDPVWREGKYPDMTIKKLRDMLAINEVEDITFLFSKI